MTGSIKSELEALEEVGRVSASGQRRVHAEFGFEQIEPDSPANGEAPAKGDIAARLEGAWSALKQRASSQ